MGITYLSLSDKSDSVLIGLLDKACAHSSQPHPVLMFTFPPVWGRQHNDHRRYEPFPKCLAASVRLENERTNIFHHVCKLIAENLVDGDSVRKRCKRKASRHWQIFGSKLKFPPCWKASNTESREEENQTIQLYSNASFLLPSRTPGIRHEILLKRSQQKPASSSASAPWSWGTFRVS